MIRPSIGILVKRFPKLSETFIPSEILALEALGWKVTIYTLERPSDAIVHSDVSRVRAAIRMIDLVNPVKHLADQLRIDGITHLHAHFAGCPSSDHLGQLAG
jgi:hypothetical protein